VHRACAALVILPLAAHSGWFEEDDAVLFTGLAESSIKRMEQDEGFPVARGANIEAVYKTLADAGIIFVPENGDGVGIRLRKSKRPRPRSG